MSLTRPDDGKLKAALERVARSAERYAEKGGPALNPDLAVRRHVLRGLAANMVRHGRAYCPCREVTGDRKTDQANICPCRTHREEIRRLGACECGLYVAADRELPPEREE